MKYLLFVVLLVFAGCGPQTKTIQENKNNKEAILIENKESEQKKDVVLSKQSLIQGVWAENEDGNALFNIEKDSLYYLESQNKPLYYNLIGDTLFVYGDVLTKFYIVKLNKDSLWFKTNFYDEITKLYKRKFPHMQK
ncbi:MAG: hypothetical protein GXO86_04235 [Chlorobi bacterium]|nr:hypothetical protein [Chlorobiota bacterium]